MSTYGNNPIQGNVPTSIFGKAIANQITPTDGQVVTFVAANDRWEPVAAGADTKVVVFENLVQVGAVARRLNYSNVDDFIITEDAGNDVFTFAINRNAADGIAGLDATSRLAKANQHSATVYNDQANSYTAGAKQSVTHDATTAGFALVGAAGDPSALVNGDIWHNTTSNLLFARLNAVTREFVFRTLAQILTNKTINADNNTITNIGSSEVVLDIITGQTAITLPVQPALDTLLIHDSSASALREVFVEDLQKKLPAVLTAAGGIIGSASNPTRNTVSGTNHVYIVLDFPNGSTTEAFWDFRMPSDIGTNLDLTFVIRWISTVTSGDVDFEAAILGRADSEAWDTAMTNATIVTVVTDAVAGDLNTTTITINTSGIDEDDSIIVRIRRLGAADTMVADARFIDCRMLYA